MESSLVINQKRKFNTIMKVSFLVEDDHTLAVFGGQWADTHKNQVLCFCEEEGHVGATPDYLASLKKATKFKAKQLLKVLIDNYHYSDLQAEF